jgi:hypothetical protein
MAPACDEPRSDDGLRSLRSLRTSCLPTSPRALTDLGSSSAGDVWPLLQVILKFKYRMSC